MDKELWSEIIIAIVIFVCGVFAGGALCWI